MNPLRLGQVRDWAVRAGFHPSRALGQNFLVDQNILDLLLRTAGVGTEDRVLEVGPGLGTLTARLLAAAKTVVAVEKDRRLHAFLQERFSGCASLRLVRADMLDVDMESLLDTESPAPWRVVSNLPYAAGTRFLMNAATMEQGPHSATVTLQKEVAQRLAADPGARSYGMISVWSQARYHVRRIKDVSSTCFWPRPAVVSSIVHMRRRADVALDADSARLLGALSRQAFGQRRKQMAAVLGVHAGSAADRSVFVQALERVGLNEKARAEDLSADQWVAFTRQVRRLAPRLGRPITSGQGER